MVECSKLRTTNARLKLEAPKQQLFHQPLCLEDAAYKLALVVGIENFERQVNELGLINVQQVKVFAQFCALDLVPFKWHPFAGIDLHHDLLTVDLIRKPFEQHLALVQ